MAATVSDQDEIRAEINVTPLVDVVLVLLPASVGRPRAAARYDLRDTRRENGDARR
jgi:hypothetical protein